MPSTSRFPRHSQEGSSNDQDSVGSDSDGGSSGHDHGHRASTSSGAGSSHRPPPKKRNRAALSCTLCRERKVKCDRVIPCQQCIKRGDAEFCHLDPQKRGPEPKGRKKLQQVQEQEKAQKERDLEMQRLRQQQRQQQQQHPGSMLAPSMPSSASSSSLNEVYPSSNIGDAVPGMSYAGSMGGVLPPHDPMSTSRAGSHRHNSNSSVASSMMSSDDIDAIKARLAQLEQVLAQQSRGTVLPSLSGASPSNMFTAAVSENGSVGNGYQAPWASAPSNQSSYGVSPMGISGSSPANNASSSFRGLSTDSPGSGRPGPSPRSANMFSPGQSFKAPSPLTRTIEARFEAPAKSKEADGAASGNDVDANAGSRGEVDSDTEDAALVLEGLAMSSQDNKKHAISQRMASDIIEKTPAKSIQGFVDEDRAEDIMTEGKYRYDKEHQAQKEKMKKACEPDKELYDWLKKNPDAVFGPDGKRLPPAKRVCVLLSQHESLFELIWGPETLLGWGMGWAFPAAEAAGDMMKVSEIVGCKGALQREAVLRAIIRSLPQRDVADHLLMNVYDKRVKFITGNVVHVPTFRKEMMAFYDLDTVEKRARVINFVDPGWLSLLLMVFVLALHFHPVERSDLVLHLFDGRTIHLWRSAAQTALLLARYQTSTSIAVLQTILLMNNVFLGFNKDSYHLTQAAINNSLQMGLHRLGDKHNQPKARENPAISIRREIAKRIWANLTLLDWVMASTHAGAYRIHPKQYNTPLPGNYNDEDLSNSPLPPPRPEHEHTDMSYPLSNYRLAEVYRQNIDMLNASESRKISCADMAYLDASYRGLLEQAPPFYRIGATDGEGQSLEVERWLFQQAVFHKLLRLHRPQLSSRTSARTSCVLLARSILDMQRRIRSRCTIIDRLFINLAQSFSAAIVLCLDLLQTRPTPSMRQIVRAEIFEALEALRHVERSQISGGGCSSSSSANENSIRVIEALMSEEETRWNQPASTVNAAKRKRGDDIEGRRGRKDLLNLALRVAKATNGETATDNPAAAETEAFREMSQNATLAEEQRNKDQHSRELFEQLMHGRPSFAEPGSFAQGIFEPDFYTQPSGQINSGDPSISESAMHRSERGQDFDLSKFLAECESNSSPENGTSSAASDSGHSSLHGGGGPSSASSERAGFNFRENYGQRSGSRSSGEPNLSPVNAFGASKGQQMPGISAGDAASGSLLPPSAFERPSTGLDGFWNWVLGQGASEPPASPTPVNANGNNSRLPGSQQLPLLASQQSSGTNGIPSISAPAQSSHMYMGDNFVGSGQASSDTLSSTIQQLANSSASGFYGASTFTPSAAQQSQNSVKTPVHTSGAASLGDMTASLGTPSAGVGWMSTPGLFDFAMEFGGDTTAAIASGNSN